MLIRELVEEFNQQRPLNVERVSWPILLEKEIEHASTGAH